MKLTINDRIISQIASAALRYADNDPDTALPRLMRWWDRIDTDGYYLNAREGVRKVISDPESNWYRFMKSFWTDISENQRRIILNNVIINTFFIGNRRQEENKKKHGCNIPWAILIDPTSACNLHCTGCWAAEYGNRLNLSYETLDDIIRQGEELGTFMYIFTGGEPLVRKKELIRLCEAHPECAFLSFTNGTLIDEEFADEMVRVGNFIPAFSIEGFEEATDDRRGKGTYQAVRKAMELMRERKLLFGTSCCYTSRNSEIIGSEEYIDAMISWGAKFAWFFTYMPVGADAVPELMATADQREYMYRQIRSFRKSKPLFTMDFWNDGEYVGGCIAGGRFYCHINANGDIEPCAFIHYSDSNIYEKTLLEAYKSPLFMAYHDSQPFCGNMLRPCPLLDNPGALTSMVENSGAVSTDLQHPEDVRCLSEKCLDAAEKWAPVSDRLWKNGEHVSDGKT